MALIPKTNKSNTFGDFSFMEALGMGISKSITETALIPVVGNANFMSSGVKLGLSYLIPKYVLKNKWGKMIASGLAVDGVEDLVQATQVKLLGNQKTQNSIM